MSLIEVLQIIKYKLFKIQITSDWPILKNFAPKSQLGWLDLAMLPWIKALK